MQQSFRKHWKLVFLLSVLSGAVTAFVNFMVLTPWYRSTALLLVSWDLLDITFDPKFRSLPQARPELAPRRLTLDSIAKSSRVVQEVLSRIQARLRPEDRDPRRLLEWMDSYMTGEIFAIYAITPDPALSADLANLWAEVTSKIVNESFGSRKPVSTELHLKSERFREDYVQANDVLLTFLKKEDSRDDLESRLRMNRSGVEESRRMSLRLRKSLRDIDSLIAEIASGGSVGHAGLDLALIRIGALESMTESIYIVTSTPETEPEADRREKRTSFDAAKFPMSVQVQIDPEQPLSGPFAQTVGELKRLRNHLQVKAEAIETALSDPERSRETMELIAQIEKLKSRETELREARDLAWSAYLTVARKLSENQLATDLADGGGIRLVSGAVTDAIPESPRPILNTALGTLAGFMLAVFVVGFRPICGLLSMPRQGAMPSNDPS